MSDNFERYFSQEYLVQWLYVGTALLLLIFGYIWWAKVYESPYNVYWGMLSNSLSTASVTKHVTEDSNGEDLNQYTTLTFGTKDLAYAKTTLTDSAGTVQTESLGTLNNDFIRYTSVSQPKTVQQENFSSVLGKWAKTSAVNSSSNTSNIPFFVQVILGFEGGDLVPIANLSAANRAALIKYMHNNVVFQTSYNNVTKQLVNGRPIYTYSVSVEPVAYVAFEQSVAQDLGIKVMQSVNPDSYQGDSAVKVKLQVDAWSHQLVGILYPGSNHVETYTGYGVPTTQTTPKSTITSNKLESLIANVQ